MKVIFLDYDGVLTDIKEEERKVVSSFVLNLKQVIDATGAEVVCTSFNKNDFLLTPTLNYEDSACFLFYDKLLLSLGVSIFDYTPYIEAPKEKRRELEIEAYLCTHKEIKEFVIIEDDYVMERLFAHQIFIEYSDGFRSQYIEPAMQILQGKLGFYPPTYNRLETFQERMGRLFPNLFSPCYKNLSKLEEKVPEEVKRKLIKEWKQE